MFEPDLTDFGRIWRATGLSDLPPEIYYLICELLQRLDPPVRPWNRLSCDLLTAIWERHIKTHLPIAVRLCREFGLSPKQAHQFVKKFNPRFDFMVDPALIAKYDGLTLAFTNRRHYGKWHAVPPAYPKLYFVNGKYSGVQVVVNLSGGWSGLGGDLRRQYLQHPVGILFLQSLSCSPGVCDMVSVESPPRERFKIMPTELHVAITTWPRVTLPNGDVYIIDPR
jgi:hypothetical protein